MFNFMCVSGLGSFDSSKNKIKIPVTETISQSASGSSVFVNIENGNLHIAQKDLVLSGLGLDLVAQRYYNAQSSMQPWKICAIPVLIIDDSSLPSVIHADGTVILFQLKEEGLFVSYAGAEGEIRLTKENDKWCMYSVSKGLREYFDVTGKILHEENALNGRITYQYENEILSSITNASGQTATIVRDNSGKIDRLEVSGRKYVQYGYDHLNRLLSVIYFNPDTNHEYQVQYHYEGDTHCINAIEEDDGHSLGIQSQFNKVKTLLLGEREYAFEYLQNKAIVQHNDGRKYEFIHEEGQLTEFSHLSASDAERISHQYGYDAKTGYLLSDESNDGSTVNNQYDARGWLSQEQYSISKNSFEKKQYLRNEAGQVSKSITEHTDHTSKPTLNYLYSPDNAYQPRFKVTGENQVTEYIYNEHKLLSQEYRYRTRFDGDNISFEDLTAWSQRPEQKYQSELIGYTYNERGDLFETKRYAELNADGSPSPDHERSVKQETDIHGRVFLIHNHQNPNQPKRNYFDAVNRTVSFVNYFQHCSTWEYTKAADNQPATLKMIYPSGLTVLKTFNSAGNVMDETESGSINGQPYQILKSTHYDYEKNNLYCVDEHDHQTGEHRFQYILHDQFNRPCLEIDQEGYATLYERDLKDNAIKTIQYSTLQLPNNNQKMSFEALKQTVIKTDPLKDRILDTVYDDLNRVRYTINPRGFITETVYHPTRKISAEIKYAVTLQNLDRAKKYSVDEMKDALQNIRNHPENRIIYHFYDSDGFKDLSILPHGAIVSYTNDPQGNVTKTERFAQALFFKPDELPISAQEVLALISHSSEDITEYAIYNKCNDEVVSIDGEGYLKESLFDNHGDMHHQIHFHQKPFFSEPLLTGSAQTFGLDQADPDNIKLWYVYDAEHRELNKINQYHQTEVTEYGYWEEPDSEYTQGVFSYSTITPSVIQGRGYHYTRDCRGNIYQSLDAYGITEILKGRTNEAEKYATTFYRDGFRRIFKEVNNQGHIIQYQHTKRGDVKLSINAEQEKREFVLNAFREVEKEILHIDENQKSITEYVYDNDGNMERKIDPDLFVFNHAYNLFNEKIQDSIALSDQKTLITDFHYNLAGNEDRRTQLSGNATRMLFEKKFDTFQRMTLETDANGNAKRYAHDKRHYVVKTFFVDSRSQDDLFREEKSFDMIGRETLFYRLFNRHGILDEQSHVTEYAKDKYEKKRTATAHGRVSTQIIRENGFGDLIEENFGEGQLTQTFFDPKSLLTQRIVNQVLVEENVYDFLGRTEISTNAKEVKIYFAYDKTNREIQQNIVNHQINSAAAYFEYQVANMWGPLGLTEEITEIGKTCYEYTLGGNKKKVVEDATGIERATLYTYDILRNIKSEILTSKNNEPERIIEYGTDDFGRISTTCIDPNGLNIIKTQKFDHADQLEEQIDGIGRSTFLLYEDHAHVKMTLRPSGYVTVEYLNLDLFLAKKLIFTRALNSEQIVAVKSKNLNVDNIIEILGGEQAASVEQHVYSADKLLMQSATSCMLPITYEHNNARQEITVIQGDHITNKIYDNNKNLAYEIDPECYVTRYIHDNGGYLLLRIRYAHKINSREYNTVVALDEAIKSLASQHDRFECHQYDMMNREQFTLDAEGLLKQTMYDFDGLVSSVIILDARYDIPADLTSRSYASLLYWIEYEISPTVLANWIESNTSLVLDHQEIFVRDGLGRARETLDSFGQAIKRDYNLSDQIIKETNKLSGETDHTYDRAGRLALTLFPESEVVEINIESGEVAKRLLERNCTKYTNDKADQLIEKREGLDSSAERVTAFGYDEDGNCATESLKDVPVYDPHHDQNPAVSASIEKKMDLTTTQIFDAFKQVTLRKTADNAVSYQLYGLGKQLVLSVDPEGYVTHHEHDGFLNAVKINRYNLPIKTEAFVWLESGTTPEALLPYIQMDPLQDRYILVDFDKLNRQIKTTEPSELYFDSTATNPDEQYFEIGKTVLLEYNSFSETILQRRILNPYENKYADDRHYYNRSGDIVAELNSDLYIIAYSLFTHDHEWRNKIEYSQPLNLDQLNVDSLTAPSISRVNPDQDRLFSRIINGEGSVIEEIAKDWIVYAPDLQNNAIKLQHINKHIKHVFDPEKNEIETSIVIVNIADGSILDERNVYHAFNAALLKISQLDAKRIVKTKDEKDTEIAPLTCFGYNVLGEQVLTEKSDGVDQWHRETYCFGKHGEAIVRFQANGFKVEMSYDAMKRVAKEWRQNDYYTLENNKPIRLKEQHTITTTYSLRGYKKLEKKYDREAIIERFAEYNPFGEVCLEGTQYGGSLQQYVIPQSNDADLVFSDTQIHHVHNRSGMVIKTNSPDGVWKLNQCNPLGFVTAKITSQIHHLAQSKFTPKYLKNLSKEEYQYTEYHHDGRGNVIKNYLPVLLQSQNPLFSTVIIGEPETPEKIAAFGQYAAIWEKPTSFKAKARFNIKLKDADDSQWKELSVIEHEENMGVNLTELRTDLYDFKIQYFHVTDSVTQNEIPYASGKDVLAVVNNNHQYSEHLVFKMETGTRMLIGGKTNDNQEQPLTGLEIIPELDPPFHVGVTPHNDNTFEANFDHVPSGRYKARRADITQPVGAPFIPVSMNELLTHPNTADIVAFFTESESNVTIKVDEIYFVETDANDMPVDVPVQQTNHVFRYMMTIDIGVQGDPSPSQYPQIYIVEVKFKNGKLEQYSGALDAQGKASIIEIIYEEKVPVVNQNESVPHQQNDIRQRVDLPTEVHQLTVKVTNNVSAKALIHENGINIFNAAPTISSVHISFLPEVKNQSIAKPKRYLYVNKQPALFANETTEAVALKLGNTTIGLKAIVDGYELYDMTEINTASLECQYMGVKRHDKTQLHADNKAYVDIRTPLIKEKEQAYAITQNMFVSMTPFVKLTRVYFYTLTFGADPNQPAPPYQYTDSIIVANKLPPEVYKNGEILEFTLDYIDTANQYNSRRIYPISNTANVSAKFDTIMSDEGSPVTSDDYILAFPIADIFPRFCGIYNPPIRGAYVDYRIMGNGQFANQPHPSSIKNLNIFNKTRNMLLYNGMPYESMATDLAVCLYIPYPSGIPGDYKKYFDQPDLTYYFNTEPALSPDIVAMKIYYDGQYRGTTAINPLPNNTYAYSLDLRHFGIADQSRLAFQFLSPNLINNYIIENPPIDIQSNIYQRMVITELPINVLFSGSQSMYLQTKTGYELLGLIKYEYKQWEGENKVSTYLNLPSVLVGGTKWVNFKYILQSMTNAQQRFNSGYQQFGSQAFYNTIKVQSPREKDPNEPAQLLYYPQGVPHYDLDIDFNGTRMNIYSDYPNRPKYFVMIKPLPEATHRIELHYRAEIDSKLLHWDIVQRNNIKYDMKGVALIDVTGLPIARYQYRLRAYDENGKTLDLSPFSPQMIDKEGYAYGQFIITHQPGRFAQVPPADMDETQILKPMLTAEYDFQNNIISETNAESQQTLHIFDKQNVEVLTRHPKTFFIKPETGETLAPFATIPAELMEEAMPESRTFPNAFGEVVGTQDPNGNMHLFHRNTAGLISIEMWPDKSQQQYHQNIFGHEVLRIDRAGTETRTISNAHGIATQVSRGPQDRLVHDHYQLDGYDKVIMHQDADGGCTLSRLNSLQQITHNIDQDGIQTIKFFDMQGNVFAEIFADDLTNVNYRDQFGYVIRSLDRSKVTYRHQYNFAMLPTESVSDDQSFRPNALYDVGVPLPRQRISHRYYNNNQLYMTYSTPFVDNNSSPHLEQSIMMYKYNINLLPVGEHFWMNGKVWKDMVIGYNPLSHVNFIADIDYNLAYFEDRNGNIRAMTFMGVNPDNTNQVLESVTLWNDFNETNEMLRSKFLRNNQGILYESSKYLSTLNAYKNGCMVSQRYYDEDKNTWITDTLTQNAYGYVAAIRHSDDRDTKLTHSKKGMLKHQITRKILDGEYVEDESTIYTHQLNGMLQTQSSREDDTNDGEAKPIFDLRQHTRNKMGTLIASQQEIHMHVDDEFNVIDHITNDISKKYVNFKIPMEARVDLTTTFHEADKISTNSTSMYFTEFGSTRKKQDAMYSSNSTEYICMSNGEIIYRSQIVPDDDNKIEIARTSMFNGRVIAQYNRTKDKNISRWEIDTTIQPFADNPISSQPMVIEVNKENMTLVDVAKQYCFGRANAAGWLQQNNPQYAVNEVLPLGALITIPYGQSAQSYSYAAMLGNTTPMTAPYHVDLPKPPNPLVTMIPLAIGTIVAIVVAPEFAGLFGNQLLGLMATGAATAAAGNLSAQASGNLLNVADGFDLTQLSTTAVMGGLTAGVGESFKTLGAMEKGVGASKTLAVMHQSAMINLAQQGFLVISGKQDQFQWQNLVADTVMGAANLRANEYMKTNQTIKDLASIMMQQAMNEQTRSMKDQNAFRSSNILLGAAQNMAMYGVAKTTTSAMVRLSQPKQQTAPKPAMEQIPSADRKQALNPPSTPKPAQQEKLPSATAQKPAPESLTEQKAPVRFSRPPKSSNKQVDKLSTKGTVASLSTQTSFPELDILNPKGATQKSYYTALDFENDPRSNRVRSAPVVTPWEQLGTDFKAHMKNEMTKKTFMIEASKEYGNQIFDDMIKSGEKAKRYLGYHHMFWLTAIDGVYQYRVRVIDTKYQDTSATARSVCAGVGLSVSAGTQLAASGLITAGLSVSVVGTAATIPVNIAAAPVIALAGDFLGNQSQQLCHQVFKKYGK